MRRYSILPFTTAVTLSAFLSALACNNDSGSSGNTQPDGSAAVLDGAPPDGPAQPADADTDAIASDTALATGFLGCPIPEIATLAGADAYGREDGTGGPTGTARFREPIGIAFSAPARLLIGDTTFGLLRQLDVDWVAKTAVVTTLAGAGTDIGDGAAVAAASAKFAGLEGLALASNGDLWIADRQNQRIRKLSAGMVSTVAGNGQPGSMNGAGTAAMFNLPSGVAFGSDSALYVADDGSHLIRRVDAQGNVTTFAGAGMAGLMNGAAASALFSAPSGIAFAADGAFYLTEHGNHDVRKIADGRVTTLAGSGKSGFAEGVGTAAQFAEPTGIAVDSTSGRVFVADSENARIRLISTAGAVTTLMGGNVSTMQDGPINVAKLSRPGGLAITPYGLAVTDANRVRLIFCR